MADNEQVPGNGSGVWSSMRGKKANFPVSKRQVEDLNGAFDKLHTTLKGIKATLTSIQGMTPAAIGGATGGGGGQPANAPIQLL